MKKTAKAFIIKKKQSILPLQYFEVPDALHNHSVFKGDYPELLARAYHLSGAWYAAYLGTYLNKDIRGMSDISNIRDFQKLISLLAGNTIKK